MADANLVFNSRKLFRDYSIGGRYRSLSWADLKHDPDHPKNPRFASNILHACSALELKQAGMIKLPVELESRGDWLEVLAATIHRRNELVDCHS